MPSDLTLALLNLNDKVEVFQEDDYVTVPTKDLTVLVEFVGKKIPVGFDFNHIRETMLEGKKIQAIKYVRSVARFLGLDTSLIHCKNFVEMIAAF